MYTSQENNLSGRLVLAMSKQPKEIKDSVARTRCGTAFERHLSEGIVDLDKGFEQDQLVSIFKLEDILPAMKNFLPPVRQSGHWITLVTNGEGQKTIGNHHFDIRRNTLFVGGRRIPQSSRYYFPKVTGYTLIFDLERLRSLVYKGSIIHERKILRRPLKPFVYLNESDARRTAALMFEIYEEQKANGEKVTELMALKIAELLIRCDRLFERERLIAPESGFPPVLEQFVSLVNEYAHKEHRLSFYIRELNLSQSRLNRLLKRHSKETAAAYVRKKLIAEIKLLLTNTRLSISAIAGFVGFSSAQCFTRYFIRNTGMSPSAFRGRQDAVVRMMDNQA